MTSPDGGAHRGWCVYVLACGDGTLYTGISNDVARRVAAHAAGRGARYTRGRGPFTPLHVEPCEDKAAALVRERAIKRLSRKAKLALCGRPEADADGSDAVVSLRHRR